LKVMSDLIAKSVDAYGILRAELLAMERYSGAVKAGDLESARKQKSAYMRFKDEEARLMPNLQRLMREAASAIRSSGEDSTFQRSKVTAAVKDNVLKSAEKTMRELGANEKAIEGLKNALNGPAMDSAEGKKISDVLKSASSSLKMKVNLDKERKTRHD